VEQIIQQIVLNYTKNFLEKATKGISNLDSAASALAEDSKAMARDILLAILSDMNISFRKDKETRKNLGLVLKEKDRPRTVLTELGEITYSRDLYRYKEDNRFLVPLDEMISVEKRERVSKTIQASLLTRATETSYQKSAEQITGGQVSRQTVHDIIRNAPTLETEPPKEKRKVAALHLYADEDHAHLQKPGKQKGKKSAFIPIVTVTEGIEKVSASRNRTIRPQHFVETENGVEDLWKNVIGYMNAAYELSEDTKIYVYGDGAGWIKNGVSEIGNASFVLDMFHLMKALKEANKLNPAAFLTRKILRAAGKGEVEEARKAIAAWIEPLRGKEKEKAKEYKRYILNNWEGIEKNFLPKTTGSCTEGQVSHVLSERFSRTPMGWSKENLKNLSSARVYVLNGGKITRETLETKERKETYKAIYERYINESTRVIDWSIFEGGATNLSAGTSYRYTENGGRVRVIA